MSASDPTHLPIDFTPLHELTAPTALCTLRTRNVEDAPGRYLHYCLVAEPAGGTPENIGFTMYVGEMGWMTGAPAAMPRVYGGKGASDPAVAAGAVIQVGGKHPYAIAVAYDFATESLHLPRTGVYELIVCDNDAYKRTFATGRLEMEHVLVPVPSVRLRRIEKAAGEFDARMAAGMVAHSSALSSLTSLAAAMRSLVDPENDGASDMDLVPQEFLSHAARWVRYHDDLVATNRLRSNTDVSQCGFHATSVAADIIHDAGGRRA